MFFRKRRILERIHREQQHLLQDLSLWMSNAEHRERLTPEVQLHTSNIQALYILLSPRNSLDWTAFFIRTGLAILIFFLLIAPPYTFFAQRELVNKVVPVAVAGQEYLKISKSVPELQVVADDWASFQESDRPDPVVLETFPSFDGRVVGFLQQPDAPFLVLWTAPGTQQFSLFRRVYTHLLDKKRGEVIPVIQDAVYRGIATVASNGSETLLAYATGPTKVKLRRYDTKWNQLGADQDVTLSFKDESIDEFTLSWVRDQWVLATVIDPLGGPSTLYHRDPVIRVFDKELQKQKEMRLTTEEVHGGGFPQVTADVDEKNKDGLLVFLPARDIFKKNRAQVGDGLQAWQVNDRGEVISRKLLTTVGMRHHFMTSDIFVKDHVYLAVHQQQVPPWFKADVGYVSSTGRSLILAYDKSLTRAVGFVWIKDVSPVMNPMERRGVAHTRFIKSGTTVYAVYDQYLAEDMERGGPRRDIAVVQIRTE